MFLKRRALQAEYFDEHDRPFEELAAGYAMLTRVNRLFIHTKPYDNRIPKLLGEERCRSLSVLDIGAGDGSFGEDLTRWAAKRGWDWRVTNLDLNQQVTRLNPSAKWVVASALQMPFADQTFDVVTASSMTHHFVSEDDVVQHFREAWRVTRGALLLNDLHRNIFLYSLLWLTVRCFRFPEIFRQDALLSVKRGWRRREWRELARRAGIPNARVWLYGGARIMLEASRELN